MNGRKHLSASGLFKIAYARFEKIKDIRAENQKVSLADALMSAFAMYSLKDPSLLAFEERRATDGNLKRLYGIKTIPCDTQMRTIADEVAPEEFRLPGAQWNLDGAILTAKARCVWLSGRWQESVSKRSLLPLAI